MSHSCLAPLVTHSANVCVIKSLGHRYGGRQLDGVTVKCVTLPISMTEYQSALGWLVVMEQL